MVEYRTAYNSLPLSYLKAIDPLRHVDCCEVNELPELSVLMVSQESENGDHALRVDEQLQFITAGGRTYC